QTLENVPVSPEKSPGQPRVALLRDVAKVERTQAPVEVYHYDVSRVSQLFVNIASDDLARVANEVERVVGQLPLQYALWAIPKATLVEHAARTFPRDRGDPAQDAELRALLEGYFKDEDAELAEEIRDSYGVDVTALDLTRNPAFRERLEAYLDRPRPAAREQIQKEYGIDP